METTDTIRRLERPKDGRWLGGVCAGLGEYFDLSPALFRVAFAALAVAGGTGIVLYISAWLVLPPAGPPGPRPPAGLEEAPGPPHPRPPLPRPPPDLQRL